MRVQTLLGLDALALQNALILLIFKFVFFIILNLFLKFLSIAPQTKLE